jgi:deoxyhypusine synthase
MILHETLGPSSFSGPPEHDRCELEASQINRMWDLLASEEEYHEAEEWVGGFASQLDQTRPLFNARVSASARPRTWQRLLRKTAS